MNELSNLKHPAGARKNRKRVGRGPGSGTGKTSARGQKGQNSRSGGGVHPSFEGGQMPLQRRLPKRGFKPRNRKQWAVINVVDLNYFGEEGGFPVGTEVTPDLLAAEGFIRKPTERVRVLADGDLEEKLVVKAHYFSAAARTKIEALGGTAEVIGG